MTRSTYLLAVGSLLIAGSAFAQVPTVEVKSAGAKTDRAATVRVVVHPNGVGITGVQLLFDVRTADNANIDIVIDPATGSAAGTAPAGWDPPTVTQDTTVPSGQKRYVFQTARTAPVTADQTFTFELVQKGTGFKGAKLTMVGFDESTFQGSSLAGGAPNYETFGVPAADIGIINGASRDLGGPMNNAVSVAPGMIAAAAGSSLWLLNPATDDLAPVAGWETAKPLDGPVSGRPAFGSLEGALAVAVGTDAGTLYAFNATSGAAAGSYKGDFVSIPTAPAIGANNNVYVAGTTAGGVQVARVSLAGGSAALGEAFAVGTAGATVQSSPAVSGNALVVGTSTTVFYASVAPGTGVLTPQAVAGVDGVTFNTSPVVSGGSAFVASTTGVVYKINLATGAVDGSSAAIAAVPLSDPFAQGGNVHFGGGDGNIYTFAAGDVAVAPTTTNVGTTPVVQPVDTGTLVVAATQGGVVKAGAESVDLGPGIGKAVSYLRDPATIVVNKVNGTVYAIPAS